jgi:hypothetical protein
VPDTTTLSATFRRERLTGSAHGHEKSDHAIVAMRPTNKANEPTGEVSAGASAAEPVERRAGTKGNVGQQSTSRAQNRKSVAQSLERVRQAFAVIYPRWEPCAGKPQYGSGRSAR